jgi:hypothetical protein
MEDLTPVTTDSLVDIADDITAIQTSITKLNERLNGMGKLMLEANARLEQIVVDAALKPAIRQMHPNASPTTGKIAVALSNAQQEIGGIAGSGSANRGSFTTLEDMEEACAPILKNYELSVACHLITNELGEFVLVMRLGHSSDEWYESRALIRDDQAQASLPFHQKIGYAEKYMKRYMYRAMLCLADNSKD